jgi:hypothetical protein
MHKALLIIISTLLLLPNFFKEDINTRPPFDRVENFDPSLSYINSIHTLEQYVDSAAASLQAATNSFEYILAAETAIKNRFYHGFSHFTLNENWIAALSGKYIEEGLACKVQPEKIIQQSNAACSQQSIVLMALLRKKGIQYRMVGFPHHYAMEVWIDNSWYFFDADMEPVITKAERMENNWKLQSDNLKKYYNGRFADIDYKFGNGLTVNVGIVNEVPAQNARIFQSATIVLSKILWLLPLLLLLYAPTISFRLVAPFTFKRKRESFSLSA